MAKIGAKNSRVLISISGTQTNLIAVRDWNWSMQRNTIDVSTIDTEWKEFLSGQINATASCNLIYDPTDTAAVSLADSMRNGALVQVTLQPQGHVSGTKQMTGTALITQWDFAGATEDAITIAASFQFTGEITEEAISG